MVMDFMEGTGRFLPEMGEGPMYDTIDLEFGQLYADDLIEQGFKEEPFYKFNLEQFSNWCALKRRAM